MIHSDTSYPRGPPQAPKTLAFFYLFELGGLLLAEQFFPPTVVFDPMDLPPPRTIPHENIIVTEIAPKNPFTKLGYHDGRVGGQPSVKRLQTSSRGPPPTGARFNRRGHKCWENLGGEASCEQLRQLAECEVVGKPESVYLPPRRFRGPHHVVSHYE
ncbi:hypothetical protein B0J17DRAFT_722924 [Rhizoctonia solani]|nr:hypothetical protein B0J17DRAFT_722924 [Rhizoctonia solani]